MVKVLIGDFFESKAQTWVNTVNCVGVMGKGVALEFKNRFPDMYEDYVVRCKRGEIKLHEVCEVFECGPIQNPANLLSQVQGCIIMGMGGALSEEIQFADGKIRNASFARYRC